MKPDLSFLKRSRAVAYMVVIGGTFLIMAILVLAMVRLTSPPATNEARIQERHKNLRDLQAANAEVLNNYAMEDAAKGVVRLPISRAIEISLQEWKNPAAARTKMLERAKLKFAAPPKAPEKPNPFE